MSSEKGLDVETCVRTSTPSIATTTFGVQGMTCSACTHSLEDGLSPHPAIQAVSVSLMNNSMQITYDTHALTPVDICGLVDDLGYEATEWETMVHAPETTTTVNTFEREVQLRFEGANSSEAVKKLNDWLSSLPVSYQTPISTSNAISTLRYHPTSSFTIRTICASAPQPFKATVYHRPSLYSRSREIQIREANSRIRQFLISFVLAIPTFIFGIVGMIALPPSNPFRQWCDSPGWWGGASRVVILLFVFATLTMLSVTRTFFVHGFVSLRFNGWSSLIRFGNMDLLVALSTGVAYVASIIMMAIDVRTDPVELMDKGDPMRTYFDAVVFLSFFILMGRALESRARLKTGDAIAMLGQLCPETALLIISGDESGPSVDGFLSQGTTVVAHDEKFTSEPRNGVAFPGSSTSLSNAPRGRRVQQIHIDEIELGDFILIPPGSIPPADGEIVDGTTTADESSLTGESTPVPKSLGDKLFTGTTNITSAVTVRVTKLGNETALQRIVRAVGESLNHKAPIEELADRITAVFIPIVIYMTLIVLAIWLVISLTPGIAPLNWFPTGHPRTADRVFFAFQFAISLLAIACPCGIGLAAPAAQAVGAGMAAKAGILAQGGGSAFQLATQVDTVVFDKTGTLTKGSPEVVTAEILQDHGWILKAVRLIEEGSTHPLAAALVKYANSEVVESPSELKILEVEETAGRGTKGRLKVDGRIMSFKLGSEAFMEDVILPADCNSATTLNWKRRGYSVVVFCLSRIDSSSTSASEQLSVAARFAISDPPRDEAARVIASLQRSGMSVWMLSGDNETTARAVGHTLGIDISNVKGSVLPEEKSAFIQELKERVVVKPRRWGRRGEGKAVVMFAGDGLNDSAAVAAADVGVAFSHGSQVTLSSASFVLLQKQAPLDGIGELFKLSKKVYRRQKLNFAWALCYNVAMIPLAGGAFYPLGKTSIPPVWSALAMALSSLSVVLSSLALRYGL